MRSMILLDTPSVCTSVRHAFHGIVEFEWLVREHVERFGRYNDYAIWWHSESKDSPGFKAHQKLWEEFLGVEPHVSEGVYTWAISPMEHMKKIDQFLASEESTEYGFGNYHKLRGETTDLYLVRHHEPYRYYHTYLVGEDTFNGTNHLCLGMSKNDADIIKELPIEEYDI